MFCIRFMSLSRLDGIVHVCVCLTVPHERPIRRLSLSVFPRVDVSPGNMIFSRRNVGYSCAVFLIAFRATLGARCLVYYFWGRTKRVKLNPVRLRLGRQHFCVILEWGVRPAAGGFFSGGVIYMTGLAQQMCEYPEECDTLAEYVHWR